MSIDYKAIRECLIGITRDLVGSELSTTKNVAGDDVPAVARQRTNPPRYDFHYILIDDQITVDVTKNGKSWFIDDDEKVVYENDYHLRVRFDCYGPDSTPILQKLLARLKWESSRNRIRNEIGAGIITIEDVIKFPRIHKTDYVDNAYLIMVLSIQDEDVDASSGIIAEVDMGVDNPDSISYLKDGVDDTSPLEIKIHVP